MFGINLFSPSVLIKLMKGQLEKQFKKEIKYFSIIYIENTNTLNISVDGQMFAYGDEKLIGLIKSGIKSKIGRKKNIDLAVAKFNDSEIEITVAYTEGENKEKTTFKL
jgi:hypothetical protein